MATVFLFYICTVQFSKDKRIKELFILSSEVDIRARKLFIQEMRHRSKLKCIFILSLLDSLCICGHMNKFKLCLKSKHRSV